MSDLTEIDLQTVIDSLAGGIYVCDLDRTIRYWSKSAERITGWRGEDVLGRQCLDGILCHIDKDGHQLCGEEYCPLHRAMITGKASQEPLLVYAQGRDGGRIPTFVSVAPLHNASGQLVGGVEIFQDASTVIHDLERAKAIQQLALEQEVLDGVPGRIKTHYVPRDIIGGDYFAIRKLDEDQYAVMLADVMGHGVAAALYTMHLSSLWQQHSSLLDHPAEFTGRMNEKLSKVVKSDESFATAACGVLDFKRCTFRFAGAGCPGVLWIRADGSHECVENPGLPLAVFPDATYEETVIEVARGDGLLLLSDGALEVSNAEGELLGTDGLAHLLAKQGYPTKGIQMELLEEELLRYSAAIRLEDDLTLIEAHFGA